MRTIITTAASIAALALLAAGGGSSSASTLPGSSSGTAATTKGFSGCLVANDSGGVNHGLNKVSWQGMKAAAAAEPSKITVKFLLSTGASDYTPDISTFVAEECGLIVTVGPDSAMAQATEASANANPKVHYAIVDCSYASHCLTGKKLKNLVSVKGTASAVKALMLARANGT
jgi:basic membrane protein A